MNNPELEIYKSELRRLNEENDKLKKQIKSTAQNMKKAAAFITLNKKLGKEYQYKIIRLLK